MDWFVKKGKISELNRDFDLNFWQAQSPGSRFQAAWGLVVDYHIGILGESEDKLRLQRSIVSVKRREG